jgi:hypothetical protein
LYRYTAEKRKAQDDADDARANELAAAAKSAAATASTDETPEEIPEGVSISPNALKALQDAEKARKGGEGGAAADGDAKSKDGWLDSVVDGMSDAAGKDRDERSAEENAKLDRVLADLSDLAKKVGLAGWHHLSPLFTTLFCSQNTS